MDVDHGLLGDVGAGKRPEVLQGGASLWQIRNGFESRECTSGKVIGTGTKADLIFCPDAELRAFEQVCLRADAPQILVTEVVAGWIMDQNPDGFNLVSWFRKS